MGVFGMRAGEGEAIVSRCLVHRPSASAVHVDMTEGPSGIGPDVIRKRGERMTNDTAESDLARLARRRIIDHMDCDDCTEDYVFLMRQGDREFDDVALAGSRPRDPSRSRICGGDAARMTGERGSSPRDG